MSTSNITREAKYIYADVNGNNNKYWQIQETVDGTCYIHWGRVGGNGQSQTKSFGSTIGSAAFFDSKCREKESKGYEKLKVLAGSGAVTITASNSNLVEIAKKQITTDSPQTLALIDRLAKANIHNILSVTTLTYDTARGTFSTPLGIVTQDAIDEARDAINKMIKFIKKRDFNNEKYIALLNQYLRLVPQKVGRKLDPETLYADLDAVQKQQDILDSLEVSLKMAVNKPVQQEEESEPPQLFEAKMKLVEDDHVIDRITKLFQSTRQLIHSSFSLGVKNVYEIEVGPMKKAFESEGKQIGNIMELWHGTKVGNLLSILKSGYVIPPANATHCTGRMFGNGVYFSDQSTKSLNYANGYWGGSQDNNCFMLLNDVAMGKYYVPKSYTEALPMKNYDSTFAKASQSGVMNNEMIVYHTKQINPKYLVEFAPESLLSKVLSILK